MESEFPGNSYAQKQGTPKTEKASPDKKIEKVVTGKVVTRKKPLGRRFLDTFVTGEDSRGVFSYVLLDIMIPGVKDIVADVITQGVERKLFGEARSSTRRRGGYGLGGPISYNRMYSGPPGLGRREETRTLPSANRHSRSAINLEEIILETRVEATAVLDQMYELISTYGVATVADLYELLGHTGAFTDERYGWSELRGADVQRVREGYLLDLPRPVPVD